MVRRQGCWGRGGGLKILGEGEEEIGCMKYANNHTFSCTVVRARRGRSSLAFITVDTTRRYYINNFRRGKVCAVQNMTQQKHM